ncbi:MAG: acyl carrier protein [Acetatifactor sp.]
MTEMELEKIKGIIAGVLNIEPSGITPDSTFIEDLGADSLDVFQIVMGIEEEFDIEISPEDAERIGTVGEAVELVRSAEV